LARKPKLSRKDDIALPGLILGRSLPAEPRVALGFGRQLNVGAETGHESEVVVYPGNGHAITFSPTGGGKGVCSVIPNALRHRGLLIVLDPKGEVYEATHRWRRQFGAVHVLDLRDSPQPGASLNPLDLLRYSGSDVAATARGFAADLVERGPGDRDRFWSDWAETFVTGGLVWLMTSRPPEEQRLSRFFDLLTSDDVSYAIAVLLDSGEVHHRAARAAFTSFLQLPDRETRPCVLASTLQHLRLFDSDLVRRGTDTTSFDLDTLITGAPMTLYITVPPARMNAFRPLLRCWLNGLLNAFTQRQTAPAQNTLILCDEAASLGRSEALLTAATLLRGWGVQLWTYWQSPAQLEMYGADARTLVDNAGVVQCFGAHNLRAAREFAELIGGVDAETVLDLAADEQIVLMESRRPQRMRRIRYFEDPIYAGQYDTPRMLRNHARPGAVR
jgi:type IV secretion system protein VirD4